MSNRHLLAAATRRLRQAAQHVRQIVSTLRHRTATIMQQRLVYLALVTLSAAAAGVATIVINYPSNHWAAIILAAANTAATAATIKALTKRS